MTEIQKLIRFLQTGKRREIALNEYIAIQERKNRWSKTRERKFLRELSMSKAFPPYYKQSNNGQTLRYLKLNNQHK